MMRDWKPLALLLLTALSGCSLLQQLAPDPVQRLHERLERHVADPQLAGGHLGIALYSLDRQEWLYERAADRLFVPASNIKLVTSAAALLLLGPEFRPRTEVRFAGQRQGGGWQGTLTLVGGGDPLLSRTDLQALVQQMIGKGLRRFSGSIAADARRFDAVRWGMGWMWDDVGTEDAPAVSALTANLNCLGLFIRPTTARNPLAVRRDPPTAYGTIANDTLSTAGGESLQVKYHPIGEGDRICVSGSLPPGAKEVAWPISVIDPEGYAATLFSEALGQAGLPLQVRLGDEPRGGEAVAGLDGRSLRETVRRLNKDSINLIAEVLLKQLGAAKGGLPGTAAKGINAEQVMLTLAGWEPESYRIVDGSGLSRYNLVSPRQFVQLLAWMDQGLAAKDYRQSLPVGGVDGTLAGRFQGLAGADRIQAKTGTMTGMTALSGYTEAANGERLAFSILINGTAGPIGPLRQVQDDLLRTIRGWQR